jgi:hypothetical protein
MAIALLASNIQRGHEREKGADRWLTEGGKGNLVEFQRRKRENNGGLYWQKAFSLPTEAAIGGLGRKAGGRPCRAVSFLAIQSHSPSRRAGWGLIKLDRDKRLEFSDGSSRRKLGTADNKHGFTRIRPYSEKLWRTRRIDIRVLREIRG